MKRMRIHVAVDNLNDSIQFAGKDTGLQDCCTPAESIVTSAGMK
ncbi:MAG: hypothetical protein QOC89_980 [Paraburkholderia sp.]|jgi:hypothetical protein|nr:hypothetical protein [Paraburkholderia sp.]